MEILLTFKKSNETLNLEITSSIIRDSSGQQFLALCQNDLLSLNKIEKNQAQEYTVKILGGIQIIGERAFSNLHFLTEINLPDTLLDIQRSAFENCIRLKKFSMPKNVSILAAKTFEGCSSLESVELSEKIDYVGVNTFKNCVNLKVLSIPGPVQLIHCTALEKCSKLERIKDLKSVNEYVFNSGRHTLFLFALYQNLPLLFLNSLSEYQKNITPISFDPSEDALITSKKDLKKPESKRTDWSLMFLIDTLREPDVFQALIDATDQTLVNFVLYKINDIEFFTTIIGEAKEYYQEVLSQNPNSQIFQNLLSKIKNESDSQESYFLKKLYTLKNLHKLPFNKSLHPDAFHEVVEFLPIKDRVSLLIAQKSFTNSKISTSLESPHKQK